MILKAPVSRENGPLNFDIKDSSGGTDLCMNAVDGVADILACGDDHGEGEQDDRGDAPMQTKHRAVDVDVGDLDEGLEAEEDV